MLVGCGRYGFSDGGALDTDHATIDFAMLACGASSSMTVTLHDSGDKAIVFTVDTDVPGVDVSPTMATIEPGGDVALAVTARADAIGLPGAAMNGELVIATDDPTLDFSIPVSLTTAGGVVTADQSTLDFGQVTTATAHTRTVMVANTGNATVSLTAGPFADPAFTITSSPTFELAAGASQAIDVRFDPALSQAYSFQLPLTTTTGATCQAMPLVLTTGVGTLSSVLLDHTTLDFGAVSCGSASSQMTLTVTNGNAVSYPYTATVSAGAGSFTGNPTSGTVPASGTTMVAISRAAVQSPAATGTVTGNLHVVVTGPPSGTTDVPLHYDVTGASLTANMTAIDFGTVSQSTQRTVMITNGGNQLANVQVTRTGSSRFSAPTSFQVPASSTKNMTITFSSTSSYTSTADFAIGASNLCSSPISIHTTGQGSGSGSGSGGGDGGD